MIYTEEFFKHLLKNERTIFKMFNKTRIKIKKAVDQCPKSVTLEDALKQVERFNSCNSSNR